MTGGRFQGLCPYVGHLQPAQAQQAVNHAMSNLHKQLLNGGHGSFAFVITAWEGGSSHAWAAINQNGTILYVDPQSGRISEDLPLYGHYGSAYDGNVVMMDALVTGPNGDPMPLPNHPTGAWSVRPPVNTTPPAPSPAPAPSPSPQPGPTGAPMDQAEPATEGNGVEPPPDRGAGPALGSTAVGPDSDVTSRPPATTSQSPAPPEVPAPTTPAPPVTPPASTPPAGPSPGAHGPQPADRATAESPRADESPGVDDADRAGGTSPQRAAEVLAAASRSELLGHAPLPVLGGADLPVRRDEGGLITDVLVDGQWTGIPSFLDDLTDRRAELWREYAADGSYPDIRRAVAQPCISVAVDRRTGLITEGHNNLRVAEGELHPVLRERLERYRAASEAREEPFSWGSRYLHPSLPGTHAEIYAVSELLWAREAAGYTVDGSSMTELRMDNHFPWMGGGGPAPCCGNCTALIPDVRCNAGKLPYFKAPEEEKWPE